MDDGERTLVVFLTMHRSGSSLAAGTFQGLGLSLGPFEPLGASPSNPHGHFEATPILELNRIVQNLAHGFAEDLPESEDDMTKFVRSDGAPDWPEIPDELFQRGRTLIEALIGSGKVSGFKDPRTVLLWPYWQRVLSTFPGVRIVPVALLRSPHEIAMSLFARREADCGYWDCLDVVAVHLRRLLAIVEGWSEPVPRVRFGGVEFFDDLEKATRWCGLKWDHIKALRMFDGACVHQAPAVVNHPAQRVYEALRGGEAPALDADKNAIQLEADGRARDRVQFRRLCAAKKLADQLTGQEAGLQERLNHSIEQSRESVAQIELAREELRRVKERCEADVSAFRREEERLRLICEDQREMIEKFEGHPILGPALRGRRRLKRAVIALRSSSATN